MVRELKAGDQGDDVTALQTLLYEMGYPEVGTPSSHFDSETMSAVLRFQGEHGLEPTGVVDEATRSTVIATANIAGMTHLTTPLIDDAAAYGHGVAPHHTEIHDHGGGELSPDGNYRWDGTNWQPVHHG